MILDNFLHNLNENPAKISFEQTMNIIDKLYSFSPVSFRNGALKNAKGENSGACKLFYFAKLNDLTELQTLHCFGDYYRVDVLLSSDTNNHMNIRNFMQTGWAGIEFSNQPLSLRVYP